MSVKAGVAKAANSATRISIAKAARVFLGKSLKCCSDNECEWLEAKITAGNEHESQEVGTMLIEDVFYHEALVDGDVELDITIKVRFNQNGERAFDFYFDGKYVLSCCFESSIKNVIDSILGNKDLLTKECNLG